MNILVTGGAGFIGSHLCERLAKEGHNVICVDNFNDYYNPKRKESNLAWLRKQKNFKLYRADIRDQKALEKVFAQNRINKIVHLAAMAGVRPSIENPYIYNDVNLAGTLNLLELAKKHKVKYFIFGSSSSVYGTNKKAPFSEDDKTDCIVSPYAATKRAGEYYCRVYSSLYGINIICLRFFTVYGPRCRPDLAAYKFMKSIKSGKKIEMFGDGKSSRDYTYVDDIVDGIVAALKKSFAFETINLGSSNPIKLCDMINEISMAVGKKAKITQKGDMPGDVPNTFADVRKAGRLLGYRPKTKFRDGIRKMAKWLEAAD
jgi:UDP-glucuronate 4-epimerase